MRRLLAQIRHRWRAVTNDEAMNVELDDELADHLRRQTAAYIAQGVAPGEAARRARLAFGSVQRYREEARDARGLRWLDDLRADGRFAMRMLRKSPLFTGSVVSTLALGIGLSTAVFAVIDATLLRPLPGVHAPDELVQLFRNTDGSSSLPHVRDVRDGATDVFTDVAAWTFTQVGVTVANRTDKLFAVMVYGDYFTVLGVQPALGRMFSREETLRSSATPVVVLSHGTWRTLFGGDPGVVGRTVVVNGRQVTIIGVAPQEFTGVLQMVRPAMYLPIVQLEPPAVVDDRGRGFVNLIARLRQGVSLEQADARMRVLTTALQPVNPRAYVALDAIRVLPQSEAGIPPSMRSAQLGLSAVVLVVAGLLLLVACVNVANLFLARAGVRAREMAIRLSLGASRSSLLRQLMVESLVFAGIAGVAGLFVSSTAIYAVNRIEIPVDFEVSPDIALSPTVLLFALGATALTAVLFGLAPALQATRPSLAPTLKGEHPGNGSRTRLTRLLVIAQMALSIMLLMCAGLFAVNLRSATTINKGFVSESLLTAEVSPSLAGYSGARAGDFYRRLMDRLRALPGVRSASMVDELPLGLNNSSTSVAVPGSVVPASDNVTMAFAVAGPGYFATMGTSVLQGREFTRLATRTEARELIINQAFADRFWPGKDAVGQTVRSGDGTFTVIGIVPTGKYETLGESPRPFMWFALSETADFSMVLVIRTTGDPDAFISTLRNEVAAIDSNIPVSSVRSMERHLGVALLPARLTGTALGVFGLLGLLLASVGMYGVVAYTVSQRTREIGIRMAIGATGQQVVRMIMREGVTLVVTGAVLGVAGALAASRLLAGLLYGDTVDPIAFGLVPFVLVSVATAAMFLPARRAATIDPTLTLRAD
ncbi:MAG: ABC transporter permease [Gemmatimonadaceae bacterium]|nr:ABC transporter permease [Gemmatimonadaceae bacterium]